MANYRRLAALCLVLLSSANIVSGQIRGTYYDKTLTREATTNDVVSSRQLMGQRKRGHKGQKRQGVSGETKDNTKDNAKDGTKEAKGGVKGQDDDDLGEVEEEVEEAVEEELEAMVEEDVEAILEEELEHVGTDHHDHDHDHEGTLEPTELHEEAQTKGAKGGTKGGTKHYKGGKHKGGKTKSGSKKSGSKKGGGKSSSEKGGGKSSSQKASSSSKSSKGSKGYEKYAGHGGGKKISGGKSGKFHYVEKKSKGQEEDHKSYDKSKYKLKKSSDGYYTEEPTEHPSNPGQLEPTLVEVPLSFYFAFDDSVERRRLEGSRRLDGHTIYEPSPEEIETFKGAVAEYAVGLFEYLHEDNPDSFYSVTPTIDKVIIHPDEPYPLQVDVTFHLLYNESPEDVPEPDEVAAILEAAFGTDEFNFFYLWGRDDIWNSVSSVKVESNFDEHEEPTMDDPVVDVWATMVYDFGVDPTTEPTEADYDLIVSLTESFFTDLLTDYYKDDTGTHFEALSIERQATTFDVSATPPVIIDYAFTVEFEEDCEVPSSDELFQLMAGIMFDDYIRLYLEPSESIWSTVDRVGLLEYSPPVGEGDSSGTELPILELEGEIGEAASVGTLESSMVHSFFEGSASRPTKEDYEKLEMVTNLFFSETLKTYYANNTESTLESSTTVVASTFYDETAQEPLQVDYDIEYYVLGVPLDSEEVFSVLKAADYDSYIMEYLWKEGEPWSNVNGVMLLERISTPLS